MIEKLRLPLLQSAYFGTHIFSGIFPTISAKLATFVWFTPIKKKPHKLRATLFNEATKFQVDGTTVISWGNEKSTQQVFLIHGWGGRWDQFSELITHLKDNGYRIFTLDLPAHGESKGFSTNAWEWLSLIQKIQKAMPDLHPTYICHSFGIVPVAYGIIQGELRAKSLVAINTPTTYRFIIDQFFQKTRFDKKRIESQLLKSIETVVVTPERIVNVDLVSLNATLPVMYIVDKADKEVPYSEQLFAKSIFTKRFYEFEGFGHNRILQNESVHELVKKFLED